MPSAGDRKFFLHHQIELVCDFTLHSVQDKLRGDEGNRSVKLPNRGLTPYKFTKRFFEYEIYEDCH